MNVQMALRRIVVSEVHDTQIVELREIEGDRKFSMLIGFFEATSIDRRVKKIVAQRPLTHDLILQVIEELGGELRDIVISDLRDQTYFAKLRVFINGEITDIDCRPSDALAVAVSAQVPIYVSEDVLQQVCDE